MNNTRSLALSLTLVGLAFSGCGTPTPEDFAEAARRGISLDLGAAGSRINASRIASARQPRPLVELVGRFSRATGRITFEPRQEEGPSGGRPLGGYVGLASNTVSLEDNGTTIVPSGTPLTFNGGDTCNVGQTCAVVTVTNDSTRLIENVRVELLDMTGATINNPDALGTGYPSSAGTAGGWNYNALNPTGQSGNSNAVAWKFDYTADFDFTVKIWGTYTRTTYTASARNTITAANNTTAANATWNDNTPAWRDACLATGSQLFSNQGAFTTATTTIPFPFAVYDVATDPDTWGGGIEVSSAGTVSLTGVATGTNAALSGGSVSDYTYFSFWDNLLSNGGPGEVCAALDSTSSAPNRRFVITWKNVNISGSAGTRLTFSAVFQEGTDRVWMLYHRWSASAANCSSSNATRGNSATAGVRGPSATQIAQISHNNVNLLPVHPVACPGAGAFYVLTATPSNP